MTATDEEILAALNEAMIAATPEARQNSLSRFLIMLKAALPHMLPEPEPAPAPPPPQPQEPPKPEAAMLVVFTPETEDHKQRVAKIQQDSWLLLREVAPK